MWKRLIASKLTDNCIDSATTPKTKTETTVIIWQWFPPKYFLYPFVVEVKWRRWRYSNYHNLFPSSPSALFLSLSTFPSKIDRKMPCGSSCHLQSLTAFMKRVHTNMKMQVWITQLGQWEVVTVREEEERTHTKVHDKSEFAHRRNTIIV